MIYQEPVAPDDTFIIDADFPGGNIILDKIEDNTIFLRPDQRDSSTWWFYWHFRVRGNIGDTIRIQFNGKNPIGTQGPAFSTDDTNKWSWFGSQNAQVSSFTYTFDQQYKEVRFCFSIPYLQANLQKFLRKHADHPHLAIHELCRTRKGRAVEQLHSGKIDGNPKYRVLLTARHHACEMIASYTLEGLLETVLSDTDIGHWFQNNVEILAIPFVDKDGVEDGDQGKNRKPHDHNRDYGSNSIYPSVQAIRNFVPKWSDGKLKVVLDLHCPYIRGQNNEVIYIVGSSNPDVWRQQQKFAKTLESVCTGSLPYSADNSLPFGTAWNTAENYGQQKSCSRWAEEQPGVCLAATIEIPYANVGKVVVSDCNARNFGRDLARALRKYLSKLGQ
ncbi:MAG: M14 family zinc carboxypeptidase [Planctomycetota bacterium]